MRFGVQVSIARGPRACVRAAVERGCEALQIFSANPRAWALGSRYADEDPVLASELESAGITPLVLHAPYLVNPAAADPDVYARSVAAMAHACARAAPLGAMVIVHAGRDRTGPREASLRRAAAALRAAVKLSPGARILVEATAGGRGSVASTIEELEQLLDAVGDERVGVCLDTCHLHAAGERIGRALVDKIDRRIGCSRVEVLHANDSRDPCGSGRDRHWHIGQGEIGQAAFRAFLGDRRLRHTAVIVETPGGVDEDRANIAAVKRAAGRV